MKLGILIRSVVLMGVFLALLAGSHVLPDPCLSDGDDCCSTQTTTSTCSALCCAGIETTPEAVFRLDVPLAHSQTFEALLLPYEFTPRDPLVRPPISG